MTTGGLAKQVVFSVELRVSHTRGKRARWTSAVVAHLPGTAWQILKEPP